jgi:hypothetical protein
MMFAVTVLDPDGLTFLESVRDVVHGGQPIRWPL